MAPKAREIKVETATDLVQTTPEVAVVELEAQEETQFLVQEVLGGPDFLTP